MIERTSPLQKIMLTSFFFTIIFSGMACKDAQIRQQTGSEIDVPSLDTSLKEGLDSTIYPEVPGDTIQIGTDTFQELSSRADWQFSDFSSGQVTPPPGQSPSLPLESINTKGTAMVYCPAKMIEDIPSIVNATITKVEIDKALKEFVKEMEKANPENTPEEIESDIKSETIDLYEKMAVKIEFDQDVFKLYPKETSSTKSFGDKSKLEWEWEITPLRTTDKSFIHFRFYWADVANNTLKEILDKRISVDVRVNNRAFLDKWKTFILGDPKTTTTAILIPLATFLGGFLTGKKNKKEA